MKLPEGTTIDVNHFVTNGKGKIVRLSIKGLPSYPDKGVEMDAASLIEALRALGVSKDNGPWRPMTREEINTFSEESEDDGA